ncbi:MAG: DUF1553 domain-containing protein [Planctomycetia bacterium]|nr:DUF1553 domain-containing protein [Planctomycetia bacterium]
MKLCGLRSFGSSHQGVPWLLAAVAAVIGILLFELGPFPAGAEEKAKSPTRGEAKISFNREIRPILSEACFRCHGPDSHARQAKLRLDISPGATQDLGGHTAFVSGEFVKRITSTDPEQRMPPPSADHQLSPQQVALLVRWVEQGAKYEPHWSFIPPHRPEPPSALPQRSESVAPEVWSKSPIDRFVVAKLNEAGLAPSAEADHATILRRLTFDLTGLPPTLHELDTFSIDRSSNAYEKVVDRLLASPRYGERMASWWLDAARYADTNGYQSDGTRFMWRWRDWVIEAFNDNKPFDKFTVEQLAGDLLPDATLDQKIATGFNRNHRCNEEGGIIPEEFRIEYVADRVETTSTVWLGLTVGCARCHDHKFDPISQKNFYELFAFFNNLDEPGKAIRDDNSPPLIKAPTREMQARLDEFTHVIRQAERRCLDIEPEVAAAQTAWEQTLRAGDATRWELDEKLILHYPLDGDLTPGKKASEAQKDSPAKTEGSAPTFVAGQLDRAAEFDGDRFVTISTEAEFADRDRHTFGAWIKPSGAPNADGSRMAVFSRMDEETSYLGFGLFWNEGRIQFDLIARITDDAIRVQTKNRFVPDRWTHVAVTYDGSQKAGGVRLFVNGAPEPLEILSDTLSNPVKPTVPLLIGARSGKLKFRGAIDDVRIYRRILLPAEIAALGSALTFNELARLPAAARTPLQRQALRAYFLKQAASDSVRQAYQSLDEAEARRTEYEATIPTTMVMQEMPQPRNTFVLQRGQYDQPGERVGPDVPDSLPPLVGPRGSERSSKAAANRLALARWLVDPVHPLTARVAVNRFWQLYFGQGLVKTTEDFGSQGEWPSHPELLDWLAVQFIDSGWNMKQMHKAIVMSATYRQSSEISSTSLARDPENRLFSRGPRFRLSAEAIRDQALAVSGLLTEKLGGPSIKPYQPAGLWEELTHTAKYKQSEGADLYRRSLYVYWRRTVPPPGMAAFDAASREICTVRQVRTNTPLQALTLLNDTTYVEAARAFAERMMREGGSTSNQRIAWAFRLATSREPAAAEAGVLRAGYERHLAHYRSSPESALKLFGVGEAKRDTALDVAELAACTLTAGVILNLDEVVTKQ